VCRHWSRYLAPDSYFGGHPTEVGAGTVNDPTGRTSHQLDVVVLGADGQDRQLIMAIGEVKWGERMGVAHLDRLHRIRRLLTAQGRQGAGDARLVCFGGAGFTDELRAAAAEDPGVALVGLADLYR
jgi:hypothetical protein